MEINNTINLATLIPEEEFDAGIEFYQNRDGHWIHDLKVKMAAGELEDICKALYDYCIVLEMLTEVIPEHKITGAAKKYEVERERLTRLRRRIESSLGYSIEEKLIRCEKFKRRKAGRDEGIGEEAMVLAIRKSAEEAGAHRKKLVNDADEKAKAEREAAKAAKAAEKAAKKAAQKAAKAKVPKAKKEKPKAQKSEQPDTMSLFDMLADME